MIGRVLKLLGGAMVQYVRFHSARIFKRGQLPSYSIGLDPHYERLVRWPSHPAAEISPELQSNGVHQIWKGLRGGQKWHHYFAIYEQVFGPRRSQPVRILEIGVLNGSSLRLWRRYFAHPESLVVGIDIEPLCVHSDAPAEGIRVRIGSQDDAVFLERVVAEFGPFDIIVDDGSHQSSHIIASFNHLYLDGLKDSGIYFVEDLHANYWPGWRDSRRSFLDMCKELIELMHAHYAKAPPETFLSRDRPMDALEVPLITTLIQEIRLFDSIAVIYKTRRKYVPHFLATEV